MLKNNLILGNTESILVITSAISRLELAQSVVLGLADGDLGVLMNSDEKKRLKRIAHELGELGELNILAFKMLIEGTKNVENDD